MQAKRSQTFTRKCAAFTLVEALVVVLLLGVVLAIGVPHYEASRRDSALRGCRANIIAIHQAEEAFRVRKRTYTLTIADLTPMLGGSVTCPTNGSAYRLEPGSTGNITTSVTISCTGNHTRNPVAVDGLFDGGPPATPGQP